ncbi:MAG: hypothetical protein CL666_10145 [Balneola sp.]|nr:hypothetical protein [Balneola sp.]|tara:strand:- start:20499 stop:21335 length:837 start_codon:yes stop_codon:yes gene_type:complete
MKAIHVLIITSTLFFFGCDSSFNPIQENEELHFSMYGVLDVHADTQWVRVMPVGRSLLPTDPDVEPVQVQLTDHSTNEVKMFKDSLFKFGTNIYVYNYWIADSVSPNQEYTITATGDDGRQSKVKIHTPSVLEVPEVLRPSGGENIMVTGTTADSVVVAGSKYLVQPITPMGCGPETSVSISHIESLIQRSDGEYIFRADNSSAIAAELGTSRGGFIVNKRSVEVVTSKSDWPNGSILSEWEISIPRILSNVENGTGVVAGVARREVTITPRRPACER